MVPRFTRFSSVWARDLERIDAAELRARIGSLLRAAALTGDSLKNVTDTVTKMLLACAADPVCRWILASHPEAQSEPSWTGFLAGTNPQATSLRTLRADRVFRAGAAPLDSSSADFLWVIDYKTAEAAPSALLLASERAQYAPQLLAYTRVLRALHGPATKFRLGLYYAAVPALDWWDPDAGVIVYCRPSAPGRRLFPVVTPTLWRTSAPRTQKMTSSAMFVA